MDPLVRTAFLEIPIGHGEHDVPERDRRGSGREGGPELQEILEESPRGFEDPLSHANAPPGPSGKGDEQEPKERVGRRPEASPDAGDHDASLAPEGRATGDKRPPVQYDPSVNPTAISTYRSFRTPTARVWAHLTRHELLARWLGEAELELAPGGEMSIQMWNGNAARGRVIEAVPPVRLEVSWRPSMLSTETHVVLRLERDGPGCRLTVTHDGLKSDPERRTARQTWNEALGALRATLHEDADAHEWGASIPVTLRALMPRSASDLWPIISTASGIDKWVAHVDRFEGEPGGLFRLTSRFQGRQVIEEGRVEEIVPESKIALSWEWAGEGWGASTRVEFSIELEPPGSALLVHHSGFDRISAERRHAARRNYATAWPEVLADLKRLVTPVAV
jgi:uncharacterized protein YndB with AHSA1/START domain